MGRWRAILFLIIALQAGLLVWSAKVHSPTWDEVGHLAAGISHWKTGRFDLYAVNPPLVRVIAAAPVVLFDPPQMDWNAYRSDPSLRSEVYLGRRMIELNGEEIDRRFFLARLAVLPIALLGTYLCFAISRHAFGVVSGLVAAALWAFSPNVLGYGSVITPDLASAVVLMLVGYAFFFWLQQKDLGSTALLSVAVGVAMLVKSVWIFLPAALIAGWLFGVIVAWWSSRVNQQVPSGSSRFAFSFSGLWQLSVVPIVALVLVNCFYRFEGSFTPIGRFEFVSQALSGVEPCQGCGLQVGNRFSESWLAWAPIPLPANYLLGIDVQRRDFERGLYDPSWKSYMFGAWQTGGWWYFYLVGLFFKESLVVWVLASIATVYVLFSPLGKRQRALLFSVLVPSLMLLLVVSVNTGLNRYVRYALPLLPLLYIWISQLAKTKESTSEVLSTSVTTTPLNSPPPSSLILRQNLSGFGCVAIAVGTMLSSPNWLSFFNLAAGGSRNDYRILCDSNVDWGQDLPAVKQWLSKHPEAKSNLHMAFFGSFDPASLGVSYRLPPTLKTTGIDPWGSVEQVNVLEDGWYIVSKNYLLGHPVPAPDGRNRLVFSTPSDAGFTYFEHLEPSEIIGNSMFVYKIDAASRKTLADYMTNKVSQDLKVVTKPLNVQESLN
jgi:energy-converting hydrogenase Eha subunit B